MMSRTTTLALGLTLGLAVTMAQAAEPTKFKVTIKDVSTTGTLKLSTGGSAPAPVSPGAWAVFTKTCPFFEPGKVEGGMGLEHQAEDGNPKDLATSVAMNKDVLSSGTFLIPVGDKEPGPALPGKAFEFEFSAMPGQKLAFTMMFGQSNDLFYAPDHNGIDLFDAKGMPVMGDITSQIYLWDAGTEINQEPGVGAEQAPRQTGPNMGKSESQPVMRVKDMFAYPKTSEVVMVTIEPMQQAAAGLYGN